MKTKTINILIGIGILAILVLGFFVIRTRITGLVVMPEEKTITNTVDASFTEDTTHIHELNQLYNVKSVRISGSIIGSGNAKIYLKKNDTRYLIYDSSEDLGLIGITGHAIDETNSSINETTPIVNETIEEINKTININIEY